jgi:hypothetical protein
MTPRRFALIVVLAAIAGVIGLRACTTTAPHKADAARQATTIAGAHVSGPIGPTGTTNGVPQGWRHDRGGARAAAIGYVALTGDIARAGFITRHDMVTQLATGSYGSTLADLTNRQINDLLFQLGQTQADPTALIWLETPLTARLVSVDAARARVDVWSVFVLGAPNAGPPRQAWRTVTVDLAWEDSDWKVAAWTARSGPTPALAPEADVSSVAQLAGPAGWPAVTTLGRH